MITQVQILSIIGSRGSTPLRTWVIRAFLTTSASIPPFRMTWKIFSSWWWRLTAFPLFADMCAQSDMSAPHSSPLFYWSLWEIPSTLWQCILIGPSSGSWWLFAISLWHQLFPILLWPVQPDLSKCKSHLPPRIRDSFWRRTTAFSIHSWQVWTHSSLNSLSVCPHWERRKQGKTLGESPAL